MSDSAPATDGPVCLIVEGSYPYLHGETADWIQGLVRALSQTSFQLVSLSPVVHQRPAVELPPNVISHVNIDLSAPTDGAPGGRRGRRPGVRAMRAVTALHEQFRDEVPGDLPALTARLRPGTSYPEAPATAAGWRLLAQRYVARARFTPFEDYYRHWHATHHSLFCLLNARYPLAGVYHSLSGGLAGFAGAIAKARHGGRLVHSDPGPYIEQLRAEVERARHVGVQEREMWTRTYQHVTRMVYEQANLIVARHEWDRRRQVAAGAPEERTVVISPAVGPSRFQLPGEQPAGLRIALLGPVAPYSDVKTFIDAAHQLHQRLPEATFHSVGSTDRNPAYHADCLRLVSRLGLDECFRFHGAADTRTHTVDILVVTGARASAQPALDAQAAGIPVVVSRLGDLPAAVGFDDRFIVAPKDPGSLSERLWYLHHHQREARTAVAARVEQLGLADPEGTYQRYAALYQGDPPA